MKFKDVGFSNVPAFDQFISRLEALHPAYMPVKAGKEFDVDLYRVYVQKPNTNRRPIDISENLLRNLEQNSHSGKSMYTKEITAKLDRLINAALSGQGNF